MANPHVMIVEVSSARLREALRGAAVHQCEVVIYSSATSARLALEAGARPTAIVVGGAPIGQAELDLLRGGATRLGVPTLAFVDPADARAALRAGAFETVARDAQGVASLIRLLLSFDGVRPLRLEADTASLRSAPLPPASVLTARPSSDASAPPAAGVERAAHGSSTALPTARRPRSQVIVLGASTGGTDAIAWLLPRLPTSLTGMVIVQHMPGTHTGAFAERLNSISSLTVREARDGDRIERGVVLVAPGGFHARLRFGAQSFYLEIAGGLPSTRHTPSVDMLFETTAREVGAGALGVLLTGMGDDGAAGLLALRRAGAHTIAQSEESCVVFGMPRRAIDLGAAVDVAPLEAMPSLIAGCGGIGSTAPISLAR